MVLRLKPVRRCSTPDVSTAGQVCFLWVTYVSPKYGRHDLIVPGAGGFPTAMGADVLLRDDCVCEMSVRAEKIGSMAGFELGTSCFRGKPSVVTPNDPTAQFALDVEVTATRVSPRDRRQRFREASGMSGGINFPINGSGAYNAIAVLSCHLELRQPQSLGVLTQYCGCQYDTCVRCGRDNVTQGGVHCPLSFWLRVHVVHGGVSNVRYCEPVRFP
ncbi:hypothetical protein Bbelb_229000 [Branchiostoma belcheri]|nr:hypothetical protein Bbelb_229000 [Branchiostoma belcheri]